MNLFELAITVVWVLGHSFWIVYFWPHLTATTMAVDSYRTGGKLPPEKLLWAQRALILQIIISLVKALIGLWPIILLVLNAIFDWHVEAAGSVLPLVLASLAAPTPAALIWYVIQRGDSYAAQ